MEEIESSESNKLKVDFVHDAPIKLEKIEDKFVYSIDYLAIINNKRDMGGGVIVKLTSYTELKDDEIKSLLQSETDIVSSFVNLQSEALMEMRRGKIDDSVYQNFDNLSRRGFFGLGKPRVNVDGKNLTKKQYLKQLVEKRSKINEVIKGQTNLSDKVVEIEIIFQDFKLPSEGV